MNSNRSTAVIILDSISAEGHRLTTFQLRYWRGIHSELMTHRVLSRNAGSSRARPSEAIIEQVREWPWGPCHWGMNQKGMQAHQELQGADLAHAHDCWYRAAQAAAKEAECLVAIGAHKQIVNRILEPFTYIDVLVTATDYANFFMLRDHSDAQPEIRELAHMMKLAYLHSEPTTLQPGEWHLPYITEDDWNNASRECQKRRITRDMPWYKEKLEVVRKVSVARCARVSYKAFDGTVAPIEKDIELFNQLLVSQPLHASPAEHQATPDTMIFPEWDLDQKCIEDEKVWECPHQHGNFNGWRQYRKMIPNEFLAG